MMGKKTKSGGTKKANALFGLKTKEEMLKDTEIAVHRYGDHRCATDIRGSASPENKSPFELVVDASEGFIPLWAENQVLRWRFDEIGLSYYKNPEKVRNYVRELLGEALLGWGDAVPIRFSENSDNSDFQISLRQSDNCNAHGCVLASAFFPDSGRHQLVVYPKMFEQSRKEQIDTMMHEIGHIFGLRHFFAQISETKWASEIFGEHRPFSIMNYGSKSELTEQDKSDLRKLYKMAWSGELVEINGTPIHLVVPFHMAGAFSLV